MGLCLFLSSLPQLHGYLFLVEDLPAVGFLSLSSFHHSSRVIILSQVGHMWLELASGFNLFRVWRWGKGRQT